MVRSVLSLLVKVALLLAVLAGLGVWFGGAPAPVWGDGFVDWAAAAATSGVLWAWANAQQGTWVLFMVGGALFLIPVLWGLVAGSGGRKDPVRLYSHEDRQVGFKRAKGRCEMDGWFWMRCHRKAEHGDHWFPHSKGGATSMANFVAACAPCNLAKSNRWPGWGHSSRIAWRRRSYFPRGFTVRPGERY